MILAALLIAQLGAGPLGVVQRIYSDPFTNKAWRLDTVQVRDGKLYDETGTLVSKADIEYLQAVNEGLISILEAGSNAFKKAEREFREAFATNPPGPSTFISMTIPPYSDKSPDNRNPYGLILKETSEYIGWYFSKPFGLSPNVVCQDIFIDTAGNVRTQYQATAWIDYFPDTTNRPAPYTVADWGRIIRMRDAEAPPDARAGTSGGYPVIIRDNHMHFGHPEHGIDWGSMLVDVVDEHGTVKHTVTGVYTSVVNGVRHEIELYRGGFRKDAPIE